MDFTGRVVMITGAAKGIGRATAELFAEQHAALALSDLSVESLDELKTQLIAGGTKVITFACDVSNESQVNDMVAETLRIFGKIDVLVNNAGIYNTFNLFQDSDSAQWKTKWEINVLGTMYCTRAVINPMLEKHYGRIINLGSVAGIYGLAHMADYSATKGAVIAFTKALAKEISPYGITVNSVSPGNINPDPNAHPQMSFVGHSGSPRECGQAILFLASEEAGYVSGQDLQADGCRKTM